MGLKKVRWQAEKHPLEEMDFLESVWNEVVVGLYVGVMGEEQAEVMVCRIVWKLWTGMMTMERDGNLQEKL